MNTYRPDIDGLRALAVLSVIAFHAGLNVAPGGYVGVDVFFVISGFLITSIICRNLERGTFSFLDFYARRSKRIFPALIIVLAATWACGWLVLLSDEYQRLGKQIAAGAGFLSNFVFWQESGYFDKAAETKPLLHLWSLGIEEQFYLLWPPLLVWLWKRKANVLNLACSIVVISFALNVILVSFWQADTFYLPPTRVWELIIGGALARICDSRFNWMPNVQSTVGVALLAVAVGGLSSRSLFPGWWALLPTLGAALLINAGADAWINKNVLASKPLVFIGLISYPLYLWHWPLLAFAHVVESGPPAATTKAAAIAISLVLASLTYWIVEKPMRARPNQAALILVPSLMLIGCIGLGLFFQTLHPRSERYGFDKIVHAGTEEWGFPGPHLKPVHTAVGYHWEQGTAAAKVMFLGDSNVEQYYPRIDKLLTDHPGQSKSVLFVTKPGCAPVSNVTGFSETKCAAALIQKGLYLTQRDPGIDTVVIGARWNGYRVFEDAEASDRAFEDVENLLREFAELGPQVYLILPIPSNKDLDPARMVKRSLRDFGFKAIPTHVGRGAVEVALHPIVSRLKTAAHSAGAVVIDPVEYLCRRDCPALMDDGAPVYKDNGHLRPSFVRDNVTFLDAIITGNGGF